MKKNILAGLSLVLVLLGAGCKTRKAAVTPTPATEVPAKTSHTVVDKISKTQVNFNTLSLRGKAAIDIGGNANNAGIQIRVENNKRIWASVTAVGFEVARALITPDSIQVINRLQSTYLKKPFSFVQGFATKQVDFQTLQDVLTGNAIGQLLQSQPSVTSQDGKTVLSGKNQALDYKMFFNELFKLTETNLNDASAGRALKVTYAAHQELAGGLFPGQVNINSMAGAKRVAIDLTFTKIEGNIPLDFPFTVPKRYEVIN
ncbi:DUF4292 domain-containing protein [Pedobacter sp. SYP-B3415]|uniref:DUF4292 domain-containing protein n=1 Tax=Pedobacter sp. SYP-B3415 TaxID=2496641 RepID=UPI00101BE011|nr:DUF4292 domain-containing protein [Pedobacter sp. SYP-B3415]